MRPIVFLAAWCGLMFGTAPTAQAASLAEHRATCVFFANAAFNDRRTQKTRTFRETLAEDCADALALLHASPEESATARRAAAYLTVLEAYRQEILAIALSGYRAGRRNRATRSHDLGGRTVIRSVSEAGAYLIARSMGVLGRQRDWYAWRAAAIAAETTVKAGTVSPD